MNNKKDFLATCIAVDYETNHHDPKQSEVIEEGITVYDAQADRWLHPASQLYDCSASEIPPLVSSANNITKEMIEDEPRFDFEQSLIDQQTADDPNLWIFSHNSYFDTTLVDRFVDNEIYRNRLKENWFCTLKMIKKLYINDTSFEANTLSYLRYKLKLPVEIPDVPHRAGYDAYVTGLLLEHIVDELENRGVLVEGQCYRQQIKAWLEKPTRVEFMPFGKHKGERLEEVPDSYWQWALNNVDMLTESSPEFDADFAESVYEVMSERLGLN